MALVVELVVLVVEGVVEVEEAGVVEDVELLVMVVELVAEVELVVDDDEVEVVVGVRLEELEDVRATYAPMPATAMMMITMAAIAVRAIPPLSCNKRKNVRATLFNRGRSFLDLAIVWHVIYEKRPERVDRGRDKSRVILLVRQGKANNRNHRHPARRVHGPCVSLLFRNSSTTHQCFHDGTATLEVQR